MSYYEDKNLDQFLLPFTIVIAILESINENYWANYSELKHQIITGP